MKILFRFRKKYLHLLKFLRRRLSIILLGGALGIFVSILLIRTHLTINQTPSLTYKAFVCIKGLSPKRGDFVSIQGHPTIYFEDLHYTKRLVGLPGDVIHFKDSKIYVGDISIGSLQKSTQDGNLLHLNKATVVPEGHVFVSADHPRSFDSRYEEFGLVKEEHLNGRCFGIFKSDNLTPEGAQ